MAAVGIVLTIISAFLSRDNKTTMYVLIAAAICLIIAGIVTRFLNQPINSDVMLWTVQNPPADWMDIRDTWWTYHIIRLISGVAGLSLLIIGLLLDRTS
jgi:uncharacterized membrane protein